LDTKIDSMTWMTNLEFKRSFEKKKWLKHLTIKTPIMLNTLQTSSTIPYFACQPTYQLNIHMIFMHFQWYAHEHTCPFQVQLCLYALNNFKSKRIFLHNLLGESTLWWLKDVITNSVFQICVTFNFHQATIKIFFHKLYSK